MNESVKIIRERISESVVPPECDSQRIDAYLSNRFTYLSRTQWQRQIEEGRVRLNGSEAGCTHRKVRGGDVVRFEGVGYEEPEVDADIGIFYEDDALLGINKTGNLPVHPSGRYFNNTLLRILEDRMGRKLYPIHRLDRETSGVILFSKRRDTASAIQKNFHRVSKTYIALVHGTMTEREFVVDAPMGFDPSGAVKKVRMAGPQFTEQARTRFRRLLVFGDYSLVKAYPETGRLHQIRVHLRYAGFPIVGDKLYGRDGNLFFRFIESGMTEELLAALELPRSALHSRSLRFFHPLEKKYMCIKSPLPDDMRSFIAERKAAACRNL